MSTLSKLQEHNLIAQPNSFIEGSYTVTKNELILLVAMISLINPADEDFLTFSVTVDELADILKIDKKSALREFRKISKRLLKRVIEVKLPNGWKMFQWVSQSSLIDNVISLRFHDDLKPHLLELKKSGNFTQYRLGMAIKFRSAYTLRVYQLLREYYSKKIYRFEFPLHYFRDMMLGRDSITHPIFKNFKRHIINVSQKELSEKDSEMGLFKADLNFDLTTRRTGRKISHLIFTIKTQQTKPIATAKTETVQTKNTNIPHIILAYEAIGVMRDTVAPYFKERGEQALQKTLNKFNNDKAKGKITKSEQGYLAYLLRVNAGQETIQEKQRQQEEINKARLNEKKAQDAALKATFTAERDAALQGFFDTLEEGELAYLLLDFEGSTLFEERVKSSPLLLNIYNMPEGVGLKDRDIKVYFQTFIIDRHLDQSLNNFGAWKTVRENTPSGSI